jgi:hypothetical protein
MVTEGWSPRERKKGTNGYDTASATAALGRPTGSAPIRNAVLPWTKPAAERSALQPNEPRTRKPQTDLTTRSAGSLRAVDLGLFDPATVGASRRMRVATRHSRSRARKQAQLRDCICPTRADSGSGWDCSTELLVTASRAKRTSTSKRHTASVAFAIAGTAPLAERAQWRQRGSHA